MTDTNHEPADADAPTDPAEPTAPRRVPVSESIRYRRRAQAAEQQLEQTKLQLDESQQQLHETQQQLQQVERRQKIDQLLMESDAVDLETARLLTEMAVQQMDEADVELAVQDLRRRKPYLFRRSRSTPIGNGSSMAPRPKLRVRPDLEDAAGAAVMTGNRRDLLRYLRLRRSAQA